MSQLLALLLAEKAGLGIGDAGKTTSDLEKFTKDLVEKSHTAQEAGAGDVGGEFERLVERETGKR